MADIIHRIGIKAPAAKVYEAVASAEGVAGWWTKDTTGTSQVGGALTFRFTNPEGKVIGEMTAEVKKLDPKKRVQWRITAGPPEWIGTDITFDLTEEDGMTILIFGHRNWKEPKDFMAHCSMKWATFLLSLRELAETGKGRPAPKDLKIDNWN